MKKELSDKALEIVTQIQSALASAGNFALEQLPDIAYQFILYSRAYYTAVMLMSLLFFVVVLCYFFWAFKAYNKAYQKYQEDARYHRKPDDFMYFGVPALVSVIPLMFVIVIVCTNLHNFFMVWFAPKVFLLQELIKLVK